MKKRLAKKIEKMRRKKIHEALEMVLGLHSAFPLHYVLEELADAVDHLLQHHNCDCQGHEFKKQLVFDIEKIVVIHKLHIKRQKPRAL